MRDCLFDPNFIAFIDNEWDNKTLEEKADDLFGDMNEAIEAFKVSDYFESKPKVDYWKFTKGPVPDSIEPFAVPSYYRTLSTYVNVLIDNGFTLKRIKEPRPTKEMCKRHKWLKRWRKHAAIFFYVHAVKL